MQSRQPAHTLPTEPLPAIKRRPEIRLYTDSTSTSSTSTQCTLISPCSDISCSRAALRGWRLAKTGLRCDRHFTFTTVLKDGRLKVRTSMPQLRLDRLLRSSGIPAVSLTAEICTATRLPSQPHRTDRSLNDTRIHHNHARLKAPLDSYLPGVDIASVRCRLAVPANKLPTPLAPVQCALHSHLYQRG